jgi:hypothetical protein
VASGSPFGAGRLLVADGVLLAAVLITTGLVSKWLASIAPTG